LADEAGLTIQVCHVPAGTSKWNKIEQRMFCHITENWRGKPLTDQAVIVNLIGNTTMAAGLTIQAELDQGTYPTGIKVTLNRCRPRACTLLTFMLRIGTTA
jgi:hypothetical protein